MNATISGTLIAPVNGVGVLTLIGEDSKESTLVQTESTKAFHDVVVPAGCSIQLRSGAVRGQGTLENAGDAVAAEVREIVSGHTNGLCQVGAGRDIGFTFSLVGEGDQLTVVALKPVA
jgi:hypothetical protein